MSDADAVEVLAAIILKGMMKMEAPPGGYTFRDDCENAARAVLDAGYHRDGPSEFDEGMVTIEFSNGGCSTTFRGAVALGETHKEEAQ